MPKYSVFLEGQNFPLKLEGETKLYGFYTTRGVKAPNEEQAERVVVAEIKSDAKLLSSVDRDFEAESKIYIKSIRKTGWWSRVKKLATRFIQWTASSI